MREQERELALLMATARFIDPNAAAPSLEELLAGTEFEIAGEHMTHEADEALDKVLTLCRMVADQCNVTVPRQATILAGYAAALSMAVEDLDRLMRSGGRLPDAWGRAFTEEETS